MIAQAAVDSTTWPDLPLDAWADTYATLHLWTQVVGKVRLACSPWINHSWHVTLYVTARGLTTSLIPHHTSAFQIDFDFIDHRLTVQASDGRSEAFALEPQSVARFYTRLLQIMAKLGLNVRINPLPNEISEAIRFDRDEVHRSYDAEYANRFWRVLVQADRVFNKFRARFIGKCSPVHFFWGAPDLAVTRFSGRPAPVAPWRSSKLARLGDARSVFARSQQLRLLARWWRDFVSRRFTRTRIRSRPALRRHA